MDRNLKKIIRKLDYTKSDEALEINTNHVARAIENEDYDFSKVNKNVFTKNGKKRIIYSFDLLSVENILCHYLKHEIDMIFNVKYSSRAKIINLLFNTLPVIKDMNDFVIIRADFKDFFNSVSARHVYEKYIRNSILRRTDKEIFVKYIKEFDYCYAGLCLSNEMAEIVSRDFDRLIKAKLEKYGIFFYERFVDDMLIMLNSFIDKDEFLKIFNSTIEEVFGACPVQLNMEKDKFSFICHRDLQEKAKQSDSGTTSEKLTYLGYEFFIKYELYGNKKSISFEYGINEKKRERYRNIIDAAFIDFKKNNNEELFRQRLKMFSVRTVISRSLGNNRVEWLTNGLTANYNELKYHLEDINSETEEFLKNIYDELLVKHGIKKPYFLNYKEGEESIYNLYSNLSRNRSIVFEKRIGVQRKDLVRWIKKINPTYLETGKRYYQMVMEYFVLLNTNNTIP